VKALAEERRQRLRWLTGQSRLVRRRAHGLAGRSGSWAGPGGASGLARPPGHFRIIPALLPGGHGWQASYAPGQRGWPNGLLRPEAQWCVGGPGIEIFWHNHSYPCSFQFNLEYAFIVVIDVKYCSGISCFLMIICDCKYVFVLKFGHFRVTKITILPCNLILALL